MWSKYEQAANDILRQVVCDCGNYRHHGVRWMPEGSGEGLAVAVEILKNLVKEEGEPIVLAKNESYGGLCCDPRATRDKSYDAVPGHRLFNDVPPVDPELKELLKQPAPLTFSQELSQLINKYSLENATDTPDFILAQYLNGCYRNWVEAMQARRKWYNS